MNCDLSHVTKLLDKKGIRYLTNEPLSAHTTFRIGGNASLFIMPDSEQELISVLSILKCLAVRTFVIGKGSNLLFDDRGYFGAVVSTAGLDSVSMSGCCVTAECGVSFTKLASICADGGLSGLEFAYGIPGSVGGAVYMNAGAYGGQVSDVLVSSRYLDLDSLTVYKLDKDDHLFGYRESAFRNNNWIHLSSSFCLAEGKTEDIRGVMTDYMKRRKEKQPLEYPSAGSTFKRYPGRYTGQMIEELGLKGLSVGGAQISEKHGGFIINKDGATCEDVLGLISVVKEKIKDAFGIEIECEVIYVKADE